MNDLLHWLGVDSLQSLHGLKVDSVNQLTGKMDKILQQYNSGGPHPCSLDNTSKQGGGRSPIDPRPEC
jgi:hypothetical protein